MGYSQNQSNLFRCPTLKGRRTDKGVTWEWDFNAHKVGYGMNAFFLGLHPYGPASINVGGVKFTTAPWLKRTSVKNPANCLAIADKQPLFPSATWSCSLWWPTACMDESKSVMKRYEGVDDSRHNRFGVVGFVDGHAEVPLHHENKSARRSRLRQRAGTDQLGVLGPTEQRE